MGIYSIMSAHICYSFTVFRKKDMISVSIMESK